MELNINSPAYFNEHYGIDDDVYRFCQSLYRYFLDKKYSETVEIVGIIPVAAPQELYDKGMWKEHVHFWTNQTCASITTHMNFNDYYSADSRQKIDMTKDMILKSIKKIKARGKFDYKSFEKDLEDFMENNVGSNGNSNNWQ